MRYGTNSRGYTILEVMIFLAISGFMFVIAASFVNGKQARAEFTQGMNEINTQVEGTINAVSNGYYPATNNFKCSANSAGLPFFNAPTADTEQGNNQGCVFLGKFMQFGDAVNITNGTNTTYNTYSVVGRQYVGTTVAAILPSTFAEARPTIAPGITETKKFPHGLAITKIVSNGATPLVGVGFLNSFSSYNATTGTLESGAQNVNVVTLKEGGTNTRNQTSTLMTTQVNGLTETDIQTSPNILICFTGASRQFGTLKIGKGNGQRLSTDIQISATLPTGC